MHELSLTQSLVEIAVDHARREKAQAILSITMEIGSLSGAIPEAVEFAFDVCTRGTLAEGARLEIRRIPGRGRCLECGEETGMDFTTFTCPHCGSFALETFQGKEMRLVELEVD
ncbi:MAG: hydrogenase maturation nickel metallochaperone HypA [Desulfuromonadales bacterium]|jgi:hydrogenase nickel incorporation protein HypA/HybF|nr:hydrogenase maturation nickel metallochaperone HypA [Desulfuromonadales bacterium]